MSSVDWSERFDKPETVRLRSAVMARTRGSKATSGEERCSGKGAGWTGEFAESRAKSDEARLRLPIMHEKEKRGEERYEMSDEERTKESTGESRKRKQQRCLGFDGSYFYTAFARH